MKQTNKLKMIASMAICVIVVFFAASCSNDAFFGFDDQNDFNEEGISNYSYFIEWDSTLFSDSHNNSNSSRNDLLLEAINRIGVYKKNGVYCFRNNSARQIGMSDELYNYICGKFLNTNSILRKINNKTSKKNGNREWWDYMPKDCFIHSISHYSADSPSYTDALNYCLSIQPDLLVYGIYPGNRNKAFENFNLSYSVVTSLDYSTHLNGAIVSIRGTYINHCVNGITYLHSNVNDDYIDFYDNQMGFSGFVCITEVIDLFIHP